MGIPTETFGGMTGGIVREVTDGAAWRATTGADIDSS